MSDEQRVEIAIVGAGIAGIATAYYLCTQHGRKSVVLIDSQQPMSFTSAQSGDNYRNWWPHPTMVDFSNRSIDLMEAVARETSNVFNLTRHGYLLATRRHSVDELVADLYAGYGDQADRSIRIRSTASAAAYSATLATDWTAAPDGADVLSEPSLIRSVFPALSSDIRHVIHIRRAGDISSQQLAAFMLERIRAAGGRRIAAELKGVSMGNRFELDLETPNGTQRLDADLVINAAGPFASNVAAMLGVELPIQNIFQQKIAFEDSRRAVPRDLPFAIDLDATELDWAADVRELLAEDPARSFLTRTLPGGRHCRPEGGRNGTWVKLGWAYNADVSEPRYDLANEPKLDEHFPEIVIRGVASLLPALAAYVDSPPTRFSHYGGYYSMTEENWPLIGPMGPDGAFTVAALSGFGSMAACAAGSLCAAWACAGDLPDYAADLSIRRYADTAQLSELRKYVNKGLL